MDSDASPVFFGAVSSVERKIRRRMADDDDGDNVIGTGINMSPSYDKDDNNDISMYVIRIDCSRMMC